MEVFNYQNTKDEIIKVGKEMVDLGLVYSTWGNISARVSNGFFITPSGMNYFTIRPQDLVLMDFEGNIIQGNKKPSVEYQLHQQLYLKRNDINAVIHTHSTYASAFAVCHQEIPPILEDMIQVVKGPVNVASYALPGTKELALNVSKTISTSNAVLLPNHGVIAVASSLNEALKTSVLVERSAKTYICGKMIGEPKKLPDEDIEKLKEMYNIYRQ